ncbi:MAG: MFS transporter [Caulobacteraceae bacterium]
MSAEAAAAEVDIPSVKPTVLPGAQRTKIFLYCTPLLLMVGLGAPWHGLIDVPVSFFLKNRLHLGAHQVATFRLFSAIPLYLAFVFGFARDTWNPLGMRDRGFFVLFGSITGVLYGMLAFTPASYLTLLLGIIIVTCSFLMVYSAQNGLFSTLAQQHVMSGQMSTVWNVVLSVPGFMAFFFGGMLSDRLEGQHADSAARILFLVGAVIMACIVAYGLWRPRVVYDNLKSERPPAATPLSDLKRLLRYWPVYPAILIWFLWDFSPGTATVLQFYLSNTLHASDAQYGDWNAIFAASFIPTFLAYGWLCRKFSLRVLLFWGTIIGIPQMIPLIFIHSAEAALITAVPIGLMGGISSAAYWDLIIRSCPAGLQGTMMMLSTAAYWLAARFGDLWGTNLYEHHGGFVTCAWITTAVYALILPVLLLVPKRLTTTRDGEIPKPA